MNILVLQLKRIGDLILTTPALVALRQHFPQAKLTLCIGEGCSGLAPAMPFVDEVLVLRRRESKLRLLARLATSQFDFCLDFTGTDRSAFFSLLSRADRRVAFQWVRKSVVRPFCYNEFVDSSVRENHTVHHYLDLLQPLGIRSRDVPVTLQVPAQSCAAVDALLSEAGVAGPFVVVHPGTARPEKYWVPGRWAEIIDHCQRNLGLPCVVTGTRDPAEQAHLEVIKAATQTPFRDLTGKLDLLGLAAVIQRAHLLLSMDSAPVHLGAAFGTRQISLFGATNPFQWRPLQPRSLVLLAGEDQPLMEFAPRCPRRPLSDLSTQTVIRAITSLI